MKLTRTLISIQEEYISTVSSGMARWAHRKDGGHINRIKRGARIKAEKELAKIGYTDPQHVAAIIRDAWEMVVLEDASQTE